ncbi:MAG: OmpA family protein [Granulosicoccus sp.]
MNIRTALAMGACLTLASLNVSAQTVVEGDVEATTDGYMNTGGMVLKTGLGECLQTGTLSDDNIINKCAGIEDEEVADAAAEVEEAAEVAEAPAAPVVPEQTAKIDTREFSEMALFDTNSAALNADGANVMSSLFTALSEYKGITSISVVGHTDSRGTDAYNQALSEQRAATIAAEISTQYPGANIDVSGMGEGSPIASNDTAEGRQQNRRVEIEITATRMTFN